MIITINRNNYHFNEEKLIDDSHKVRYDLSDLQKDVNLEKNYDFRPGILIDETDKNELGKFIIERVNQNIEGKLEITIISLRNIK